MATLRQLLHEIHRRSIWQVLGALMLFVRRLRVNAIADRLDRVDYSPGLECNACDYALATQVMLRADRPHSALTGEGPGR